MKEKKRTFEEIRILILLTLSKGQKTINQIAKETDVNWRTVENHLVYLLGKNLVKEVFKSEYVRIFELSDEGKYWLLKEYKKKINIKEKKVDAQIRGVAL